jgi:hypothetical protein
MSIRRCLRVHDLWTQSGFLFTGLTWRFFVMKLMVCDNINHVAGIGLFRAIRVSRMKRLYKWRKIAVPHESQTQKIQPGM